MKGEVQRGAWKVSISDALERPPFAFCEMLQLRLDGRQPAQLKGGRGGKGAGLNGLSGVSLGLSPPSHVGADTHGVRL